jgi:hypothetical protein
MSSEPERPIEKQLRASAQERRGRAAGGLEMHPATRRVLQGEVARRFGRRAVTERQRFAWLFRKGWVQSLGAMAALGVVVIAAWFSFQPSKPQRMAKNEQFRSPAVSSSTSVLEERDKQLSRQTYSEDLSQPTKPALADSAGTPASPESAASSLKKADLAKDKEITIDRPSATMQPSGGIITGQQEQKNTGVGGGAAGNNVPSFAATEPLMSQRYGLARGLPSSVLSPPAAPAVESSNLSNKDADALSARAPLSLQDAGGLTSLEGSAASNAFSTNLESYGYFVASPNPANGGRAFRQSTEAESALRSKTAIPGNSLSANQILVSFRVERTGRELRVIDQDGSVYAGTIRATTAGLVAPSAQMPVGDAHRDDKLQGSATSPSNFELAQLPTASAVTAFQVVGTNRTWNQKVVFSGTLTGNTGALGRITQPQRESLAGAVQLLGAQTNQLRQGLRVSGRAVIGAGQMIDINAAPAPGQ